MLSKIQPGFTLVELLVALVISAMLLVGIAGITNQAGQTLALTSERQELLYQTDFAMERIVNTVQNSTALLLPLADKVATNWREHVREETVPPSPPEGDSVRATAVLAATLDLFADLDGDGFSDADNDRDGLVDEDMPGDMNFDLAPGIYLIDDNGDGVIDENIGTANDDDDETWGVVNEDPLNGLDDDNDGNVDEDVGADMNADFAPGIVGVDDDGDGFVDEGLDQDDDEDGAVDEDWLDAVVYYMNGGDLVERIPVPWDEDGGGIVSGRDYIETIIAQNITRLRFEYVPQGGSREQLVDITIELTGASGLVASLNTRVRVGSAR